MTKSAYFLATFGRIRLPVAANVANKVTANQGTIIPVHKCLIYSSNLLCVRSIKREMKAKSDNKEWKNE